ncbi:hypothetical protein QWZ13_15880 [Reinekea marina]|nr:hypothetical protein [Reinekea marina]MDN3650387.1 hypothetical protein [Reinekea marina]
MGEPRKPNVTSIIKLRAVLCAQVFSRLNLAAYKLHLFLALYFLHG